MKTAPRNLPEWRIRRARPGDAAQLAGLSGQLGYPSDPKTMSGRLREALRARNGACFVAESKEHGIVGWVHVSTTPLLEVSRRAEVNGLVVDERIRSRGAGARLLVAAEQWARKMGCTGMSVRSNVLRERAHEFYLRQGYEHYKTQKAFRKSI
jgi:GNAT superfamily N-acetyltransferase